MLRLSVLTQLQEHQEVFSSLLRLVEEGQITPGRLRTAIVTFGELDLNCEQGTLPTASHTLYDTHCAGGWDTRVITAFERLFKAHVTVIRSDGITQE